MSVTLYFSVLIAVLAGLAFVATLGGRRFVRVIHRLPLRTAIIVCTGWLTVLFAVEMRPRGQTVTFEQVRLSPASAKSIVLIHGWTGDQSTWDALVLLLLNDDRFADFGIVSLGYESKGLFERATTFEKMAKTIASVVAQKLKDHKLYILTHSTGGVLGRMLALDLAATPSFHHIRIERLVTVAAPHAGTDVARTAGYLGVSQFLLFQLRDDSTFLQQLAARWTDRAGNDDTRPCDICIASSADHIVSVTSATAACRYQIQISSWGHAEVHRPSGAGDERYRLITTALLRPFR